MIKVLPSTIYDAPLLAPRLRPEDIREVETLGSNAEGALQAGCYGTKSLTVMDGEDPIGMFGVTTDPQDQNFGLVWLLASEALFQKASYRFVRESRHWLTYLEDGYLAIHNIADERNESHLRWLRWLGFTFLRRIPSGVNGETFIEFIKPCATQPEA